MSGPPGFSCIRDAITLKGMVLSSSIRISSALDRLKKSSS
nr:MAG TPA: hypothetical protein [Caudoviricetes sp.]